MAAAKTLHPGIHLTHLKDLDCIYRSDPVSGAFLFETENSIFGVVNPRDAISINPLTLTEHSSLYIPLAIGRHVDHILVRQAAESWHHPKQQIRYFEDFPYSNERSDIRPPSGYTRQVFTVERNYFDKWLEAVLCYQSQISSFWRNVSHLAEAMVAYLEKTNGLPVWKFQGTVI